MNLSKAIEINTAIHRAGYYDFNPDDSDAIKLGIEALKNLIHQRADWLTRVYKPLPGETKE